MTAFLFAVAVLWGVLALGLWATWPEADVADTAGSPEPYDWREDFAEIAALPETSEVAR